MTRLKQTRKILALLVIAMAGPPGASTLPAQNASATAAPEACQRFVQQFYDWYLAKGNELEKKNSEESALAVALREKASSFSPELVKALEEDEAAAKKSPDEVVGLDFDPFLNAQDTPERYVVGEVHQKDGHYRVEVFGIWNGKKNPKPDVVPELALKDGKWIFTNFHYEEPSSPENENLVSVLQQLKQERSKATKPEG